MENLIATKPMLPAGWRGLDEMPSDAIVEVMDEEGRRAFAEPTYYPFEVVKKVGDEKKQWGWRGTPVFYEDGKSKWDGGWLVNVGMEVSEIGTVKYWRETEPACR